MLRQKKQSTPRQRTRKNEQDGHLQLKKNFTPANLAEGHQPSAGARNLGHIATQISSTYKLYLAVFLDIMSNNI